MKLFPIPQLQSQLPTIDESDFWEQYELVTVRDKLIFPKDNLKSPEEQEMTEGGGHIGSIEYEETELKAENQSFTQRHLENLGVKSRPTTACPFTKHFPMYLLRGSILKQQTRLPKHEELVTRNLLIEVKDFSYINLQVKTTAGHYIQDPDDQRSQDFGVFLPILSSGKILKPWKRIIFISHRWLNPHGTPPHPDDNDNTKLRQLKEIIMDDDYVMIDYISFPQDDFEGQGRAINSLCWFIYHCSCYRIISPNRQSFEDFLGRGWCQLELLAAFCPVLATIEELSNGNFYMDYEETRIDKLYTCAATDRALIIEDDDELSLKLAMVKNPSHMDFTIPDDKNRIQGVLDTITAAFKQALPRKEDGLSSKGEMTAIRTLKYYIRYEDTPTKDVEELLQVLST